jgi:hypothetical protein
MMGTGNTHAGTCIRKCCGYGYGYGYGCGYGYSYSFTLFLGVFRGISAGASGVCEDAHGLRLLGGGSWPARVQLAAF